MIVAAAKGRPNTADDAERAPIETNFGQRGPHQCADENEVAASFGAKQFDGAAKLPDRNPVMTELFGTPRIAHAPYREQDGLDSARGKRVGDREWHHTACCDQADGR